MDDTNKNLEERIAQLPADVRQAVLSVEWEAKVQALGAKHHLHIDQIGLLGDLTLMTLLGLVALTDFPTRVAQEVKVSADDAAAITHEIDSEVFMPIRESLKKMTPSSGGQPAPAPTAPSAFAGTPAPIQTTPAAAPTAPIANVPAVPKPDLSAADAMLTTTSVTAPSAAPIAPAAATPAAPAAPAAPSTPPKPQAYSADPYREPPL